VTRIDFAKKGQFREIQQRPTPVIVARSFEGGRARSTRTSPSGAFAPRSVGLCSPIGLSARPPLERARPVFRELFSWNDAPWGLPLTWRTEDCEQPPRLGVSEGQRQ
jgi:hypothetical protein